MIIRHAESFRLRVPVPAEIADSRRMVSTLEFVGVLLTGEDGTCGTGYTVTVGHGGKVIQAALDELYVAPLIGRDADDVRRIWRDLHDGPGLWIGRAGATTMAQAAVDIALWDLRARGLGQPLWRLLGAARGADLPAYNTHGGWLNFSGEHLVAECRTLLDQGYRAVKMKVGGADVSEDLRRVAAVRAAIGDDALLMVDANQAWDLTTATRAARGLEASQVTWLEEPLHPDDVAGHARLARRSAVPIALGEHVYGIHAFRDFIQAGAVEIVQVDVCRVGGITPWLEVASLADAAGLRVCPHCGDLSQVHQHLMRAIPNGWMLEVIPLWPRGPFVDQVRIEDGLCALPTAPGAATAFEPAAFERYREA